MNNNKKLIAICFLLGGLILITLGVFTVYQNLELEKSYFNTRGVVIDIKERQSDETTLCAAIIEYEAFNQKYKITENGYSEFCDSIGTKRDVLYDPENPSEAVLMDEQSEGSAILFFGGIIFITVGCIFFSKKSDNTFKCENQQLSEPIRTYDENMYNTSNATISVNGFNDPVDTIKVVKGKRIWSLYIGLGLIIWSIVISLSDIAVIVGTIMKYKDYDIVEAKVFDYETIDEQNKVLFIDYECQGQSFKTAIQVKLTNEELDELSQDEAFGIACSHENPSKIMYEDGQLPINGGIIYGVLLIIPGILLTIIGLIKLIIKKIKEHKEAVKV